MITLLVCCDKNKIYFESIVVESIKNFSSNFPLNYSLLFVFSDLPGGGEEYSQIIIQLTKFC